MWECGLKRCKHRRTVHQLWSLLMWECGLKPSDRDNRLIHFIVTPYVGVWIETYLYY